MMQFAINFISLGGWKKRINL